MRLKAQFRQEARESAHVLPELFIIGFLLCAISVRALDLLSPAAPMDLDCRPVAANRAVIPCAIRPSAMSTAYGRPAAFQTASQASERP